MTKRKITIIYDPDTAVEDETDYDLYAELVNIFDNASIHTHIAEKEVRKHTKAYKKAKELNIV